MLAGKAHLRRVGSRRALAYARSHARARRAIFIGPFHTPAAPIHTYVQITGENSLRNRVPVVKNLVQFDNAVLFEFVQRRFCANASFVRLAV